MRSSAPLTYRHRAGVRLYTSSCELAESCVFDKQSLVPILCGSGVAPRAPLVPRVRGHFAEFLHEGSPERLRMLAWHTCVGLRYGPAVSSAASFSRPGARGTSRSNAVGLAARGLLTPRSPSSRRHRRVSLHGGWRTINRLSIGYALGPRLRSRLTLGGLTFPRKPGAFGGRASHPSCRYSFRHTHLPTLHRSSRSGFAAAGNALLPCALVTSATAARRLVPVIFGAGWLDR